jgi:hypothetical protein
MALYKGNSSDNIINGSLLDDDIYGKGGNDTLSGLDGNDFINGGAGDDFLFGGDGDDILVGGKGTDWMQGGAGADEFRGGEGVDTVDYSSSTTSVTAFLALNSAGGGDAQGDTYAGMENVVGSAYDDLLQAGVGGFAAGGSGADTMYGGGTVFTNEDGGRLRGDAGYDELSMYYGATEAQLQNGQGYDTLDVSEIRNSLTGTASGTNAQFIYEDDVGKLWFDNNGSDAGGKILVALLDGATIDGNNLGVDDFNWVV